MTHEPNGWTSGGGVAWEAGPWPAPYSGEWWPLWLLRLMWLLLLLLKWAWRPASVDDDGGGGGVDEDATSGRCEAAAAAAAPGLVRELERDVDSERPGGWCSAGSDGLWRMLPVLATFQIANRLNRFFFSVNNNKEKTLHRKQRLIRQPHIYQPW